MWRSSAAKVSARRAAYLHASNRTQRPIGTIKPVSSASGMKSSGGMIPFSGSNQRISASTPVIFPVGSSITGW